MDTCFIFRFLDGLDAGTSSLQFFLVHSPWFRNNGMDLVARTKFSLPCTCMCIPYLDDRSMERTKEAFFRLLCVGGGSQPPLLWAEDSQKIRFAPLIGRNGVEVRSDVKRG